MRTDRVSASTIQTRIGQLAWLAQRQPPLTVSSDIGQRIEITMVDLNNCECWNTEGHVELLYDLRFVVRIKPDKMPDAISKSLQSGGKLVVESRKPWYLPEICHIREDVNEVVHSQVAWPYKWRNCFRYDRDEILSDWIAVHYIRPISAL